MSAVEKTIKEISGISGRKDQTKQKSAPVVNRVLDFISSVRLGVCWLCLLVIFAMIGMLIVQQNVNGFDTYYASLTPAEKYVYSALGFFNVYYSWYFNLLLLLLSTNIVLASIDHFPAAWSYIRKPKLFATRDFLLRQKQSAILQAEGADEREVAEKIGDVFKANGLSVKITQNSTTSYELNENGEKDYSKLIGKNQFYVFGESGKLNRLGAYIVHVFLLTLFLGHFVALQTGFDADLRLVPGDSTTNIEKIEFNLDQKSRYNVVLPFTISCTDIQQTLIDPKGTLDVDNTLDWRTQIKIDDPQYGTTVADISMNKPFSYRGYRFFQAQTIPLGSARRMTLEVTPQDGGAPFNIELQRNGSANLPDGTKVDYEAFFPDFVLNQGKPDTRSSDYNNPAVKLNLTTPAGEKKPAYAFSRKMPDNAPIGAAVAGYKWRLTDFEKVPLAHILSIKYDPYNAAFVAWYVGGFGLIGALGFVFFVSHRRVWASIERKGDNDFEIVLGGDTNRNGQGFEDKFQNIAGNLRNGLDDG